MVQADFESLGNYIARQNPYSTAPKLPGTLGTEGGPGVLTVDDKNASDPWVLTWDFREPAASGSIKKWEVVNYRIARAVVVPNWYAWTINPPKDGSMPILYANILIGYTPPAPGSTLPAYQTFVDTPAGNGTGSYGELGELIARRFPFHAEPTLLSEVDENGDLSNVVTAVSFLADKSAASGNVFQRNSDAMTLDQRQECLYWDGPRRLGSMPPEPTASSTQDGTYDGGQVFNYQITKAFRIPYRFVEGGSTYGGWVFVGNNGSGDG
jgi:hypothetical protein